MSHQLLQTLLCTHLDSEHNETNRIKFITKPTPFCSNWKQKIKMCEKWNYTCAMKRTLEVWPVSSAILTIDGYFHRVSWFWVNPWELRSSRSLLLQSRAHTWEPVSMEFKQAPVWVFQNLMVRSPPPPPDASKLLWNGHHARALTAAVCSSSLCNHWVVVFEEAMERSHMWRRLSLPPLANCWPEADHFSPQTSWWWPL